MSSINSVDPLATQSARATATGSNNQADLGQEEYLKLMITQFQNQDPFKPMENGEFLGQIAQFGTVSGISELKESFSAVAASISSDQTLQASGLIGRTVLADVDSGKLSRGGTLSGAVDVPVPSTRVSVEVLDSTGQVMRRLELGEQGAGLAQFSWNGLKSDGTVAPPGNYTFKAQIRMPDGPEAVGVLVAAEVQSVSMSPNTGSLSLNFANLDSLGLHQIRQIQ
ncbi:MAG: flagellar hook assembly protein FlgD [Gammaproteobacteria bacterium]|nr:flagellar hook assembly protein FlgD [Gammaproteobacteria bacterium]